MTAAIDEPLGRLGHPTKSTISWGPRLGALAPFLKALGARLEELRAESYLVGGFWRDLLGGRPIRDLDLAVEGDPLALGRRLAEAGPAAGASVVALDPDRGVVRLALPGGAPGGAVRFLDMTPLRGGILADLARRDFTIDAIAAPLTAAGPGPLVDPYDGVGDLGRRLLRAVDDGVFQEDALRLLRALRLWAELGLALEDATARRLRRDAHLLSQAAPERQREELCRLLATPRAGGALALMEELGLLDHALPEVAAGRAVEQPKEHYYDVLGHSLATVAALDFLLLEQEPGEPQQTFPSYAGMAAGCRRRRLAVARAHGRGQPPALLWRILWQHLEPFPQVRQSLEEEVGGQPRRVLLKLAALLHDVAKPATRSTGQDGRLRFLGHAKVGAEQAEGVLARLRFSHAARRVVKLLVAHHLRPGFLAQVYPPTRRALHRLFRDLGELRWAPHADAPKEAIAAGPKGELPALLLLHLADHAATRGPHLQARAWEEHSAYLAWLLAQAQEEEARSAPPLVNGHDLMAALHLGPGPQVGRLLRAVAEAQALGEVRSREEALALARGLGEMRAGTKER